MLGKDFAGAEKLTSFCLRKIFAREEGLSAESNTGWLGGKSIERVYGAEALQQRIREIRCRSCQYRKRGKALRKRASANESWGNMEKDQSAEHRENSRVRPKVRPGQVIEEI